MKNYLLLLVLACLMVFSSCENESVVDSQLDNNRPYNPWVFRSVLDEKPRMITLALHDDLWAAYSTKNASLYKIWKGRVNFDGAVYNTMHGPQPTTIGDAYFENKFDQAWELRGPKGADLPYEVDYKGHRYVNDQAVLVYHLIAGDYVVKIKERVEAINAEDGSLVFQRDFDLTMPSVLKLYLKTNVNSISFENKISTDGNLEIIESKKSSVKGKEVLDINGKLQLNRGETKFHITLMDNPVVENPWKSKYADEDKGDLPPGAKLIAKSDCKSCHNKNVKTIGPSYLAIAKKYADTDDNLEILASKVKKGGGGVWGPQLMTAHPEYTLEDIREMVSYILSIADPENIGSNNSNGELVVIEATDVNIGELIPGAITRVFEVPAGTEKFPLLIN